MDSIAQSIGRMYGITCRTYGGIKVNGVAYLWDYAREELIKESDLLAMKKEERDKRRADSERAKWNQTTLGID